MAAAAVFSSGACRWTAPVGRTPAACVSSARLLPPVPDTPQTSLDLFPTTLRILLNGILIHTTALPDHPHDSRGVLSYLRGGVGAYGYPTEFTVEGALLDRVRACRRMGTTCACVSRCPPTCPRATG